VPLAEWREGRKLRRAKPLAVDPPQMLRRLSSQRSHFNRHFPCSKGGRPEVVVDTQRGLRLGGIKARIQELDRPAVGAPKQTLREKRVSPRRALKQSLLQSEPRFA